MKFDSGIGKKYRKSVEDAFETILEKGDDEHRMVATAIVRSEMLVRVKPVSDVNASGVTGLINPGSTNDRIEDEILSVREALGEVYIVIAEETIDTGGQQGCEGTFVHEGRHAYDFAETIVSFSEADMNPLSIFDPTLYELEYEAHRTSGEYLLRIDQRSYQEEGIGLLILGRKEESGRCFVDGDGICKRLSENYGLVVDGNQGPRASELLGLRQK